MFQDNLDKITVGVFFYHRLVNLVLCMFGSDGIHEIHKDYTGLGRMSLRPIRGYSCILHLFAVGGVTDGRERESQGPKSLEIDR